MPAALPKRLRAPSRNRSQRGLFSLRLRNNSIANTGIRIRATRMEAPRVKVLVKASGLNSLPSAPVITNTGKKPRIVVVTAVMTAPPTSLAALWTDCKRVSPSGAFFKRCTMFSLNTMPMSAMVPIAIAIPESATIFASMPNTFISTNAPSTVTGKDRATSKAARKRNSISKITTMVTSTSKLNASSSVPSVS